MNSGAVRDTLHQFLCWCRTARAGGPGPAGDRGRRRNWPGSSRRAGRRCLRDRRTGCPDASVGHIVSERGRPPDFMMEVASPCAARVDAGAKRDGHAALDVRSTGATTRAETISAQGSPATSCTATPTVRCQSKGSARTSRGGTARPWASSSVMGIARLDGTVHRGAILPRQYRKARVDQGEAGIQVAAEFLCARWSGNAIDQRRSTRAPVLARTGPPQ